MLKRNYAYNVGNIDYNLDGTRLVCKVAGTTGIDPIRIPSEATEVVDGTVTWSLSDGGGGADSIAEMSAPSSVFENIVISNNNWGANNYIAPANGFIIFTQHTTSSGGNMAINLLKVDVNFANSSRMINERVSTYLVVRRGDSCTIRSNCGTVETCKFIYSVGSAKKLGLI